MRELITIQLVRNLQNHDSPILSLHSIILHSSSCFYAHATTFGWMLDHDVVEMHVNFNSRILIREQITIQLVRLLNILSPHVAAFKNSFWLSCFHAHATTFEWMLEYDVVDMHVNFHCRILRGRGHTIQLVRNLQIHTFTHYVSAFKHSLQLSLFSCSCHIIWMDVASWCFDMHSIVIAELFTGNELQYNCWEICRSMRLPKLSFLSNTISNLANFSDHTTKFG